jgi:hypothetical protein
MEKMKTITTADTIPAIAFVDRPPCFSVAEEVESDPPAAMDVEEVEEVRIDEADKSVLPPVGGGEMEDSDSDSIVERGLRGGSVTCEVDAKDDVLVLAIDLLPDRVVLIVKKSEVPSEARVGDSDTSAGDDDDWGARLS